MMWQFSNWHSTPCGMPGEGLYYIHTKQTQMRTTHRFDTFKEALNFLMEQFGMSNQQATHFIWDNITTIGTDRGLWIIEPANFWTGTRGVAVPPKTCYSTFIPNKSNGFRHFRTQRLHLQTRRKQSAGSDVCSSAIWWFIWNCRVCIWLGRVGPFRPRCSRRSRPYSQTVAGRGMIMNYDNFWKNVLGQEDWVNELVKWENAHPEYTPKTPRRIDTVPISELSQDP